MRRDSCALVKDVSERILEKLMYDRDPEAAHQVAREAIVRMVTRQEPIDKFVVSKTLRNDYKNANQAHVGVASLLSPSFLSINSFIFLPQLNFFWILTLALLLIIPYNTSKCC